MTLFLYGSDTYRLRQALQVAIAEARAAGPCHLLTIDGGSDDAEQQLDRVGSAPGLFGERQIAVITSASQTPNMKQFLKHAENLDVIASQNTGELDAAAKRRLDTLVKLASKAQRFDALTGTQQVDWITAFCKERDRAIHPAVVAEVVRRTGSDTWRMAHELEKLCAYTEHTINEEAVHALVPLPATHDEWEFSNALAARDKRAALRALWRRLHSGIAEQQLVGLLASASRTLVAINDGIGRGLAAPAIAKAAGLHPFVVSKNLQSAGGADGTALRAFHVRIARLDRDAKRGRADLLDGLFGAILSMP